MSFTRHFTNRRRGIAATLVLFALMLAVFPAFSAGSVAAAPLGKGEKTAATPTPANSGKGTTAPGKDGKTTTTGTNQADRVNAPLIWPRYGIDVVRNTAPDARNAVKDAGAQAVRLYLNWNDIEPNNTDPANYAWAETDAMLTRLNGTGIESLVIVQDCPTWACASDRGPFGPDHVGDFVQFMTAVTQRYSVAPYNVHRWEFWNEPDATSGDGGSLGWGRHGDLYAGLLAGVVPVMRGIDPLTTITMGGLGYDWFTTDNPPGPFYQSFLPDVLHAGGGQYMDYLAFHYYAANIHWRNIKEKFHELQALATSNGYFNPLVVSETGLTSSPDPRWATPQWGANSNDTQSRFMVETYVQSFSLGVPSVFWFTVQDYSNPGDFEPFAEAGLIKTNGNRKPSFNAYSTITRELGQGAYVRQLSSAELGGDQMEGYVFEGKIRPVWVIWSNTTTPGAVQFTRNQFVRVRNMYGVEQPFTTDTSGHALVTIGQDPVFVEFTPFTDVPSDYFAYNYIEYLIDRGIVAGYADHTFRPYNNTTRGQLAKIITLGEGWPINTSGGPHFNDVTPDNPFYTFIETAYNHGAIAGYGDGSFRWYNNVTRGQLSKIIVRARGWATDTSGGPHFRDVAPDNTFYNEIETAYHHGIINGYGVDNGFEFRWYNNATRAQIAKIENLALTQ